MAAGILSKPGSKFGPCRKPCAHLDCADTRKISGALCPYCSTPIGYDRRFYATRPDRSGPVVGYEHASCAEDAAEAQ